MDKAKGILAAVEFLRTFVPPPTARKPDMKHYVHGCGSPSCAAGWLYSEGIVSEEFLWATLEGGCFAAVFGSYDWYRKISLDRLGIDMPPGAQTGVQSLRDAADRLEAVGALVLVGRAKSR